MEASEVPHTPDGPRGDWFGAVAKRLLPVAGYALRAAGMYRRGVENALAPRHTMLPLAYEDLPAAFDGYRILHLTDLQLDALPDLASGLIARLDGTMCDLCALTGDFQADPGGAIDDATLMKPLSALLSRIDARDGFLAILGNHDPCTTAGRLEAVGIRVLANEYVQLERNGEALDVVGLDDVGWFFTSGAQRALDALPRPRPFTVALVHSPEFAAEAAAAGCRLYLSGHTHGGQICLPGGIPVITRLRRNRRLVRGRWAYGDMIGYTNAGIGVADLLPVRFNCPPEILTVELRRDAAGPAPVRAAGPTAARPT